jgi:hypothetical protein
LSKSEERMGEREQFCLGQFVLLDGRPAVVVGLPGGAGVATPDDHLALWFGHPQVASRSKGGPGDATPEVWTVPVEDCQPCQPPEIRH